MMRFRKNSKPQLSLFERTTLPGVPSVFTGRDTTLAEQRAMATEIRDVAGKTATEVGLAISLLAALAMLENMINESEVNDA